LPYTSINHPLGVPFIEINTVDSSNNYAVQQVHKGLAEHGTAYFAYEQTAGKGQRGKLWVTKPGENIVLSVVLNTKGLQISQQFDVSMAVSLSVFDLFIKYALTDTCIKWPNDLYWCDRKAAGILIENLIYGKEWQWAIAGIGININQTVFDSGITHPVSLKQITGKSYDPVLLAKELCGCLEKRLKQLIDKGGATLLAAYNNVLYKHNLPIKLKKDNAVFNCTLKEVNAFGQLVVQDTMERVFNVGDVEWVIA